VVVKERAVRITAVVVLQAIGSALLLIFGFGLLFLCAFIAGGMPSRVCIFLLDALGFVPDSFTLVAGGMVIMALIGFFIA